LPRDNFLSRPGFFHRLFADVLGNLAASSVRSWQQGANASSNSPSAGGWTKLETKTNMNAGWDGARLGRVTDVLTENKMKSERNKI